jgi:hypothetical protein
MGCCMSRLSFPIFPILLLGIYGCVTDQPKTETVSNNPFGHPAAMPARTQTGYAPAGLDAAARVDQVGRRLLAANKQAGLQPLFRTIGSPQAEIFHRGTAEIDITEGLVKQCLTEGQLAGVLCTEMGKVVAERETVAAPRLHAPELSPPPDLPIGNDGGLSGAADQMHRAEVARFEQDHPRRRAPAPPPEPTALAKTYMTKAGFTLADLDAVAPFLRAAEENNGLARQLLTPPPGQR